MTDKENKKRKIKQMQQHVPTMKEQLTVAQEQKKN